MRLRDARVRRTAASAAPQRSGTLAQPQAVGKYPPCAAASPTTGANAIAAGAYGARRWWAPVASPLPSDGTELPPSVDAGSLGPTGAALRPLARRLIAICLVAVRVAVAFAGRGHAGENEA